MQLRTRAAIMLAVLFLLFMLLACNNGPQPEYCSLDPKPLICDQ